MSDKALRAVMNSLLVAAVICYLLGIFTGPAQKTESPTWPAGMAKKPAFGVMQMINNEGLRGRTPCHRHELRLLGCGCVHR